MLSDIRSNIHSCSNAINCMSRSSPCPILSHSSSVSGSTSTIFTDREITKWNKTFHVGQRSKTKAIDVFAFEWEEYSTLLSTREKVCSFCSIFPADYLSVKLKNNTNCRRYFVSRKCTQPFYTVTPRVSCRMPTNISSQLGITTRTKPRHQAFYHVKETVLLRKHLMPKIVDHYSPHSA